MSRKKQNCETAYADDPIGTQLNVSEKHKPQPRMVEDPFTNEMRPENKQERFRRLAEQRVTNACRRISMVCSLGNIHQYEYTEDDANKIMAALQESVNNVRSALSGKKDKKQGFKL